MRWLVASSVRFRLLVLVAAAATLVVGASQLRKMPVEVLPDFTPTTVEVQTEALGLSAPEVEQLITVPLEQDLLNGVAFLKDIRSESVPGLSRILLIFDGGTDVLRARQVVAERLTQAHALPQVSKPPRMLQPLSSTDRVMLVGMTSKSVSALRMGVLARWTIVPRLVGVPGVANVAVWGEEDRQLQVQVDPERLRDERVRLDQVIDSTANALWVSPLTFVEASTPGTGGFIDTPNQRLGIQHVSPITTAGDLAKVRLEETDGRNLVLGDVARVVENHQPLIGDGVVDGDRGLLLVVQRFPGTSLLDVTKGVQEAIDSMQPGLSGIDFDTSLYRPATYVERSIDNVALAVLIGLGLLALAFGVFFRWRTALVGIAVIPLSLVTGALVLWAFGTTMNAFVLLGLAAALALVIDDAIISVENTTRKLRLRREQGAETSIADLVTEASLDARRPTLYATLIVALAVLPVFFLERVAGAFFPDVAGAYLLALLASMVVALTVTPALSVLVLSRAPGDQDGPPVSRRLQERYERALSRIVRRPRIAYVAVAILVVAAGASAPFLGQSLVPTFKENELLVHWEGPPGTSLPEMNRITALASRELRALPGITSVGAHVGRAVTGDQIVGANAAEMWVSIDGDADYDRTVAAVKRVVAGYPGISENVETYSQERRREALAGTNEDLVVRIYGEDLHTLGNEAATVRRAIAGVDGVSDPHVLLPAEEPTVQVRVDLARAKKYGVTPGDVRRAATTLISGLVVGSLFEQQKVFDVVVWGGPQTRSSVTSVRRLLLDTHDGGHVRLADVADVRIVPSPGIIRREAVSRYVDVGASVSGRGRDAVVGDVQRRLQQLAFPIEYHAEVLGAETQPAGRLISVAIAAVIGMFLLLQVFFSSWRLAFFAIVTAPIGVVGGLVAALAGGGQLSFGSYIALFAVFGVAARGGILLFDRFRQLEQDEGETFGPELVLRAARERVVPVVLTAVATGLVFAPILIMGSRPGYELIEPAAVVLLGGLSTCVLFNLFVLPALYLRFGFSFAGEREAATPSEELVSALESRVAGIAVLETRATSEWER
jgi:Cu/Ag efflux pump CusA